ncbi:hypothetical protein LP420_33440 [Massilia sp. B-10]|nr:hypothetical protein LP420_33440 [Massilia sp. B-10]
MRLDNPTTLDLPEIKREVALGNAVTVQYSGPCYTIALLESLDKLCGELDANLCIRFYGHYFAPFDCANLKYLPSVKHLELNCMDAVENIDALKQLQCLVRLNIGIFELNTPDFLSWPNLISIADLSLPATRKNNIDLKYLGGYSNLVRLFLGGHVRHLDTIGTLYQLTDLSLNLPSAASLTFLNRLPNLRRLRFILGGRANLDEIVTSPLERLEIVRVKGFSSLNNLHRFRHLKSLLIEDQAQLKALDLGTDVSNLTEVRLVNCKNLETVSGLSHLSKLNSLRVFGTSIDFAAMVQQKLPKSLKIFAFYTNNKRKNATIKEQLTQLGYSDGLYF